MVHDCWCHENAANCDGFRADITDDVVVEAGEFEDISVQA